MLSFPFILTSPCILLLLLLLLLSGSSSRRGAALIVSSSQRRETRRVPPSLSLSPIDRRNLIIRGARSLSSSSTPHSFLTRVISWRERQTRRGLKRVVVIGPQPRTVSCSRLGRWRTARSGGAATAARGNQYPEQLARHSLLSFLRAGGRPREGTRMGGGWEGEGRRGGGVRVVEGESGEGMRRGRKRSGVEWGEKVGMGKWVTGRRRR